MTLEVDEFLEHFGKKGMKWGVRRAQKQAAKADQKWQKNIYSVKGAVDVHNSVADKMNGGALDKLNGQAKYKNLDAFDKPNHPTTKAYFREYEKLTETLTRQAVIDVHGTSPSGQLKATLDTSGDNWKVSVSPVDLQHAEVVGKLVMELNHDESGYITSSRKIQEVIAQSFDSMDAFIQHYGKKGMKWGVRGVRTSDAKDSGKERTKYGKSPKRLTNAELEKRIKRMDTEKKYNDLNKRDIGIGEKIVSEALANTGRKVLTTVLTGGTLWVIRAAMERHMGVEIARAVTTKPK